MTPKLTTPVQPKVLPNPFELGASILAMGSCFADHVSAELASLGYPVTQNPYGIVYHPLAIATQLQRILDDQKPDLSEIQQHEPAFHYLFHGDFSRPTPEETLQATVSAHQEGTQNLLAAKIVVLTLGTAFAYQRDGSTVANCHKQPAKDFARHLITAAEISAKLTPILQRLTGLGKQVVLTVSPVRHLRDDVTANQLSKANLLIACDQMQKTQDEIHYFPSYEIMMDELRDYRFYADDLIHPSSLAIRFIVDRFLTWAFADQTFFKDSLEVRNRRSHRLLRPDSEEAKFFIAATKRKTSELKKKFPFYTAQ